MCRKKGGELENSMPNSAPGENFGTVYSFMGFTYFQRVYVQPFSFNYDLFWFLKIYKKDYACVYLCVQTFKCKHKNKKEKNI